MSIIFQLEQRAQLVTELNGQFLESAKLEMDIRNNLRVLGYDW